MKIFTSVVLSIISLSLSFVLSASEQNISYEAFRDVSEGTICVDIENSNNPCSVKEWHFVDIETGVNCIIFEYEETLDGGFVYKGYIINSCEVNFFSMDIIINHQNFPEKTFTLPETSSGNLFEITRSNHKSMPSFLQYQFIYSNQPSPEREIAYKNFVFQLFP